MSKVFNIAAQARKDQGKGASRRLRRSAGLLPAVVYGAGQEPQSITLVHKDLWKMQEDEAFYSSVLTLNIDGVEQPAVIKDMQRHPAKALILHVDFLRIDATHKLSVNVPLHFINEGTCPGVKLEGGSITHQMTELEVRCLAKDIPEFIEVDMAQYHVGKTIHISDLKLPEGVESVALAHDHDLSVAQILAPRGE